MGRLFTLCMVLLIFCSGALATIFGTVRGIVHDPQHRPVSGINVVLAARNSDFSVTASTDDQGQFHFDAVPVGEYSVTVSDTIFVPEKRDINVLSGSAPILHFELRLATQNESVTVSANSSAELVETATPTNLIDRGDIREAPGATRSNSVAMITNYVPGSYVTHDQLHVRGGHQVSWLIDGVPIPNTNIASNLGPQIDPKDIDTLEAQRGSYAADFGDRTYGIFNIAPRTGFEWNNDAELVASFGNFFQTDDQLNFGGHTNRFAYYASVNGNRTDLGLETPTSAVIHDRAAGYGGFTSLMFNVDPQDQLRVVTSLRRDHYQIPNAPDDPLSSGLRDANDEADAFVAFSWVRTFNPGLVMTVSPFYHYNSANYESDPDDFPTATTDRRASHYEGGQITASYIKGRNNARVGAYGFAQQNNEFFGLMFNDPDDPTFGNNFRHPESISGSMVALFAEDEVRATDWLTLTAGIRQTHFSGGVVENATSPRFGVAVRVPKLKWVFRGFYGRFYQAPPLLTASGPLLQFVNESDLGFIPLRGERDEESQFGVAIPYKGWMLDIDTFKTRARNFFDHSSVGNSDVFFPLTIDGALIRGWEVTLRSPQIARRAQVYVTYSNQIIQGRGAISGGLTDFEPPEDEGYFLLDHDQRHTLHVGGNLNLPWHSYASTDIYYGSGFADEETGGHLPGHTTFDLTVGKNFGERFSLGVTAINVANRRFLLDNSVTFGGTHYVNPREIYAQVRYRFHF